MRVSLRTAALVACAAAVGPVAAQSHLHWKPGPIAPGPVIEGATYADVTCSVWWDPDGTGPRQRVLVVGGEFEVPSLGARNLAWWDPQAGAWGAFADAPNGLVQRVAVMPDHRLVIGGQFTAVGATPAGMVAFWDGSSWSSPAGGLASTGYRLITALVPKPDGDLIVGGHFSSAGGAAIASIARWDGSQWHALGAHNITTTDAIALRPNGNLVVGGSFPGKVAEWDGVAWHPFAVGLSAQLITTIAIEDNGDVLVGLGLFTSAILRWNGSFWVSLTDTIQIAPYTILPLSGGTFLAGRVYSINGTTVDGVGLWDGTQWLPYAPSIGLTNSITFPPGSATLFAAGRLSRTPTGPQLGLARWDGSWQPLGTGFDNAIERMLALPTGDVFAFGRFRANQDSAMGPIARWTGQAWSPFAGPTPAKVAPIGTVDALGNLWLAHGAVATSTTLDTISRWTGAGWQSIGAGANTIASLTTDGASQPVVGSGSYAVGDHISRWNGTFWTPLGQGIDGPVLSLLQQSNGDLVAGGDFLFSGTTPLSRIGRWDGTAWSAFGPGLDGRVKALLELPSGELIAAGEFVNDGTLVRELNLVARWDGTAWWPLGDGISGDPGASVNALLLLPNGDLLAGGSFRYAGGAPTANLARWDGSAWHPVDGGVDGPVFALTHGRGGEILVGGNFATVGGRPAAHFALLRSDFPAVSAQYGTGCAGPFGQLVLESASLPWLGSTYRSVCYGVSPSAVGIDVYGVAQTQLPLAPVHPSAAGCDLLLLPVASALRMPTLGTLQTELFVPLEPSLLTQPLFQQLLVVELDPLQAITNLASSNGISLTFGAL